MQAWRHACRGWDEGEPADPVGTEQPPCHFSWILLHRDAGYCEDCSLLIMLVITAFPLTPSNKYQIINNHLRVYFQLKNSLNFYGDVQQGTLIFIKVIVTTFSSFLNAGVWGVCRRLLKTLDILPVKKFSHVKVIIGQLTNFSIHFFSGHQNGFVYEHCQTLLSHFGKINIGYIRHYKCQIFR